MKITVITPTTNSKYLEQAVESVLSQTHTDIQYIVVADGVETPCLPKDDRINVITLPYKTGINQYNGHRIYGSMIYLAEGEYITFLDEDNFYSPHHLSTCIEAVKEHEWVYTFRNIVDADGHFITQDNCESLGHYKSVLNDYFVDVGCFFLRKDLAVKYSPLWYRQARVNGVEEVDRILTRYLLNHKSQSTKYYGLNYRVGNTERSVQAQFFINGNKEMKRIHNGELPWQD